MSTATVALPFGLQAWIDQHVPQSLGSVGNKEVFKGSDFIFQIIKGPNARNEYHIDPWDEIFYQLQGDMFLSYIDGEGQHQQVCIGEGEVFLLPKRVPHSPQRPAGSIGLVIERPRTPEELDAVVWFCEQCGHLLHEVEYWREDTARGLKEIIRDFNTNEVLRTCIQCGAKLPDPSRA